MLKSGGFIEFFVIILKFINNNLLLIINKMGIIQHLFQVYLNLFFNLP